MAVGDEEAVVEDEDEVVPDRDEAEEGVHKAKGEKAMVPATTTHPSMEFTFTNIFYS